MQVQLMILSLISVSLLIQKHKKQNIDFQKFFINN